MIKVQFSKRKKHKLFGFISESKQTPYKGLGRGLVVGLLGVCHAGKLISGTKGRIQKETANCWQSLLPHVLMCASPGLSAVKRSCR